MTHNRKIHLGVRRIQIRLFKPRSKALFRHPCKGHVMDETNGTAVCSDGRFATRFRRYRAVFPFG